MHLRQPRTTTLLEGTDLPLAHLLAKALALTTRRHGARPRIHDRKPRRHAKLHGLLGQHQHPLAIAYRRPELHVRWRRNFIDRLVRKYNLERLLRELDN